MKLPKHKRKLTPRKALQLKIKDMDPAECGPLCATAPLPEVMLKLKEEFEEVFPEKMLRGYHRYDAQITELILYQNSKFRAIVSIDTPQRKT